MLANEKICIAVRKSWLLSSNSSKEGQLSKNECVPLSVAEVTVRIGP